MRYCFDEYILDTEKGELRRAGGLVRLEPKVYQVLVYLIENHDRLVTKGELLDSLWADTYVVDTAISRCIRDIRRALRDTGKTQQMVQTRRGYGYRFIAMVAKEDTEAPHQEAPAAPAAAPVLLTDLSVPPVFKTARVQQQTALQTVAPNAYPRPPGGAFASAQIAARAANPLGGVKRTESALQERRDPVWSHVATEMAQAAPPMPIAPYKGVATAVEPQMTQAGLLARIDQLPPDARRLLKTAAVIGTDIPLPLLQTLVALPVETLYTSLMEVKVAGWLSETCADSGLMYTFTHARLQRLIYQSLPMGERLELHAKIARLLAKQFPGITASQPELLAYHYDRANLKEQAAEYWLQAGQRAMQRAVYDEAIRYLNTGLALLRILPKTPEHSQRVARLQTILGLAFILLC